MTKSAVISPESDPVKTLTKELGDSSVLMQLVIRKKSINSECYNPPHHQKQYPASLLAKSYSIIPQFHHILLSATPKN